MSIFWRQAKKQGNRRLPQMQEVQPRRLNPALIVLLTVVPTLFVSAYALWLKLSDPKTLPLQQVRLEAPFNKVAKAELYAVVKNGVNGGFFSVDVEAITQALQQLPWVDQAQVRRVWPDTLQVSVTEQVAMARWRDDALINLRGELFVAPLETFPEGLVELRGPDNTVVQMAQQFYLFNEALQQTGLVLRRVTLTDRRAWEVELDDQSIVILGRSEMDKRLQRFVKFYPQLVTRNEAIRRVDMRYTNGFAVQWQV